MPLILGAGCAGLALARSLVDAGSPGPITLIDRRTAFENDRTWCFWEAGGAVPRAGAVVHRWHRWELVGRDGERVEHETRHHPYAQLGADRYYAESLTSLGGAPQVEIRLGERVVAVDADLQGGAAVRTSGAGGSRTYRAEMVVDAMGGTGPLNVHRRAGSIELRQSFLGLEIEASRPVFDPSVATIMDFRTGPGPAARQDGLHFVYVLPTSPTRALVEHTTLGPSVVPSAVRRREIATYLRQHHGAGRFEVVREERGVLPMTTHAFPVTRGPGLHAVGAAAGAVRPSSGYAFVRLQRHAEAVATAIVTGGPLPERVADPRHDLLDGLFLRALAVAPSRFDRTLMALARRTDADAFARFMSDASSVRDELSVMASLARPGFVVPMLASSLLRPLAPIR